MRRVLVLLVALLALTAGCGGELTTAEAAAASAQRFMASLSAGDFAGVWGALTSEARERMGSSAVAAYLRETEVEYDRVGDAVEVEPGLMRVPVAGLTVTDPGRTVKWPEAWLTLRQEGDGWLVAWADPLFDAALSAYHNTEYVEQLDLARAIVAIDPYHYRGHLEMHYAFRGLGRLRQAEHALQLAQERATAAQKPDVLAAWARFKLAIGAPADALGYAQQALDLAKPYYPGTYSPAWWAETLVLSGQAALALGDGETAALYAEAAAAADPKNAALALFRQQLPALPANEP
ncbi:hypothetical protein J2Z79_000749 [Symbiobacterium terraclitae]|uniref:Lipoprotein n=1 Tax=Symbiobacterium terraclitae TaxID=557451 RepID=A0ABS4JP97_9FIRM|nr:hypothetical protein [Symbiobacterium terraclitae]MBP2017366.1 hypothetical protein [Symbiobacterium terraclitae]